MGMAAPAALSGREPAVSADAFPAIRDYALIGNCRTAALVSRAGAIEWLCLPTFSSPSLFAAVLDRDAGTFSVSAKGATRITRRYVDDTNVLETTFETPTGRMRLTDCLTLSAPARGELYPEHEVLRRVECLEGEVDVEVLFEPRWDYGRVRHRFASRGKLGWAITHCPFGAMLLSDVALDHDGDHAKLAGTARLAAGDERWVMLAYDQNEAVVVPALGGAACERLDHTIAWWREWSARCNYDGPHADMVRRSVLALKLMTCSSTGAVVAAPTTSLPEEERGPRNWDYRFCWIRDSAFVLHAFVSLGYVEEAEAFLEWLLHATRLTWERFQVMYDIFGETKLDEHELSHLGGYRGARPVRIGNAAHDQLQLDIYGELLETVARYVDAGGSLDRGECRMLAGVGERLFELWRCPDQGIWETRSGPRHHTFSKAMCWVAFDRLRELAKCLPIPIDRARLDRLCEEVRRDVEEHGFNRDVDAYVAYYDAHETDASLLLLARYGYAKPGDARMESTYRYIERTLSRNGLILRYAGAPQFDGVAGGENSFAPCNFWAAEYLANAGRHEEAEQLLDRICGYANDVGLLAEEFSLDDASPMGNFPQALTHVSLISAVTALYRRPTATP
jgi:GH15 family glucan-1,4-alpha-glucosidase